MYEEFKAQGLIGDSGNWVSMPAGTSCNRQSKTTVRQRWSVYVRYGQANNYAFALMIHMLQWWLIKQSRPSRGRNPLVTAGARGELKKLSRYQNHYKKVQTLLFWENALSSLAQYSFLHQIIKCRLSCKVHPPKSEILKTKWNLWSFHFRSCCFLSKPLIWSTFNCRWSTTRMCV